MADTDDGDLDTDVAGDHALMDQVVARWTPARQKAAKNESLFLPRATLPESPFRFMCIDDLSRAAHFHPYELGPTREELSGWCDTIGELLEKTEKEWR